MSKQKQRYLYVTRDWMWGHTGETGVKGCYGSYRLWIGGRPNWKYGYWRKHDYWDIKVEVDARLISLGIPFMRPGPEAIVEIPIGQAVKLLLATDDVRRPETTSKAIIAENAALKERVAELENVLRETGICPDCHKQL